MGDEGIAYSVDAANNVVCRSRQKSAQSEIVMFGWIKVWAYISKTVQVGKKNKATSARPVNLQELQGYLFNRVTRDYAGAGQKMGDMQKKSRQRFVKILTNMWKEGIT